MVTRRETVVLSLDDQFTTGMARAAAATALLNRSLNNLDGSSVSAGRGLANTATQTERTNAAFRRGGSDIDRYSGRLRLIADAALTLGPSLVPIGAVAIPAVTGLASAFGFAAAGATASIVAFQGVGNALKAVSEAQLEPTAANLEKARQAMEQIAPAAREFVTELSGMMPALKGVRDAAAEGLFPGMVEALDSIEGALPRVSSLFEVLGTAMGDLAANAAESITGPEWAGFFNFIQAEAPDALATLGSALGSLSHGLAEMWMAFDPLNDSFLGWLKESAEGFDAWAASLSRSDGFADFVDYIRESGPQVAEAMGALGSALVQLTQAIAPLGGPSLQIITSFANALSTLADSPLGTPLLAIAAGLAAVSRAAKLMDAASGSVGRFKASLASLAFTGPAATIAIGGLFDALDSYDSLQLAGDAAEASAVGIQGLSDALNNSNVGKYAAELGIDVQRLSEDLYKNGTAGLYAQDVMGRLEGGLDSAGDGFKFMAGSVLPFFQSEAEKSSWAASDLANIIDGIARPSYKGLDGLLRSPIQSAYELSGAAKEASDALLNLSDILSGRASMRAFEESIDSAKESLREIGDMGKLIGKDGLFNINIPAAREAEAAFDGIAANAAKAIEGMKPLAAADFLASTRQRILGMADAFNVPKSAIRDVLGELNRLGNANAEPTAGLNDGPFRGKKAGVDRDLKDLDGKKADPLVGLMTGQFDMRTRKVKGDLKDLDNDTAKPKADLQDNASGLIASIAQRIRALDGDRADTYVYTHFRQTGSGQGQSNSPNLATGGEVRGPGTATSDSIPAWLSNGEFVVRAAAVDHYGPEMLHRLNAMRLAEGGLATHTHAKRFASGGPTASEFNFGGPAASPWSFGPMDSLASMLRTLDLLDNGLRGLSKKELDIRGKDLDRTEKAIEKWAEKREELAQKEVDADRERLQTMIDARDAFAEQVGSLFKSNVFENQGPIEYPDNFWSMSDEEKTAWYAEQEREKALQSVSGLQSDINDLRRAMDLYKGLVKRGFDGPAFRDLVGQADVQTLEYFSKLSSAELQQIESLYNQRDKLAQQNGAFVGNAEFGGEIKAQTRQLRESVSELRDIKQENKQLNQKVNRIERLLEKADKAIGKEVGKAVNGAAVAGKKEQAPK